MRKPAPFVLVYWLVLGAWAVRTNHAGRGSAQETPILAPGDHRLDAHSIRPYARQYLILYVPLGHTAHMREHVAGILTERVEVFATGGDTVLLQIRETDYGERDKQTDTLILARETLAPIRWRTHRARGPYNGGLDFAGNRVAHFGMIPEETVDTLLERRAFLHGSQTLLIPTLLRGDQSMLPARASMVEYMETDWSFWIYHIYVRLVDSVRSPSVTPQGRVWQVSFGRATYWVERESFRILQWEEPAGEGGYLTRFVAHGR